MKDRLRTVISILIGIILGVAASGKYFSDKLDKERAMSEKHLALFLMMNQWIKVKQEGKNLANYLKELGYLNIAIYGISYAGKTLIDELKDSDIKVIYGIDKKLDSIDTDINLVSADDELEPVDAIVVTAITFFPEIQKKLSQKIDCQIVSLEDLLYEI